MRSVVLSLGLALLCVLHAEAEDLETAGLDESKLAGKWHIVALASDSEGFLRQKDKLKMSMAVITVLEDGDLKVAFAIPTPEQCYKSEWIYKKTGVPGEYHSAEKSNTTARVVDTDGKTYGVVFASKVKNGKTFRMLRLYSRTRAVTPKIAARFRKFAREKSFTDEMIKFLPSQDECSLDQV